MPVEISFGNSKVCYVTIIIVLYLKMAIIIYINLFNPIWFVIETFTSIAVHLLTVAGVG